MMHAPRASLLCGTLLAATLVLTAGSPNSVRAQTPCNSAAAPQCDGACPVGQDCEEQSGVCTCRTNPNPCGVDAGPPLCYGECPPANPICADVGGTCACVSGATPTPTVTSTPAGPTPTFTPGGPTPTITPTASPEVSVTPSCAEFPIAGCRTPSVGQKALLTIKDKAPDDAKDLLQWKWLKGSATTKADFGSPLTNTSYQLCIYNGASTRIVDAAIPAGGLCDDSSPKPCWKETSKGFDYKDKDLSHDGIQQLKLKEGADGKAQVILKGKGERLEDPAFPITQPVTVQLLNTTNSICWEAIYSQPATKNTGGPPAEFKDKSD